MKPHSIEETEARRETVTRGNLPVLSTALVPVTLALLLCGMTFGPRHGQAGGPTQAVFTDGPQPKPPSCNKVMQVYLQEEYCVYRRFLAQERPRDPVDARRRRLTRQAVDAYNEVAGDADPSAFARTSLPRHLDYPDRPASHPAALSEKVP